MKAQPTDVNFACDSCIERAQYTIKVIVHGIQGASFWQQVRQSAVQTATSLRINLQFSLYQKFDPVQMAQDIRTEASCVPGRTCPDALIVSMPTVEVRDAVEEAITAGLAVFAMNAGGFYQAEPDNLLAFTGMDDFDAGIAAGKEALHLFEAQEESTNSVDSRNPAARLLFINHEKGNYVLEQRRLGIEEVFENAANLTRPVTLEELVLPLDVNQTEANRLVREAVGDCTYEVVVPGNTDYLQALLEIKATACANQNKDLILGTFDTNLEVYENIAAGVLDFAISQEHWLQASMITLFAGLYATTGQWLQRSTESDFGNYLTGPKVVTIDNLPTDTLQSCETQGYPICSGQEDQSLDVLEATECPCFSRPNVRIAAVTHGSSTESFWLLIQQAARQAAADMNIELDYELFEPGLENDILHNKMASKMISLCQEGVQGIMVSVPTDRVRLALERCRELNVPIVSINAGGDIAEEVGLLHHVAQDEYNAGIVAGQEMLKAGITRGLCINHAPGVLSTINRCQGFEKVLTDAFGPDAFLGDIPVAQDNDSLILKAVRDTVNENGNGDWTDLGLLSMGQILIPQLITLLDENPEAIGATFDTGPELADALRENKILFGVDQQPYVQGYMPIIALTWLAQTSQSLQNLFLASGPKMVFKTPSAEQKICEDKGFPVCLPPIDVDENQLGGLRVLGFILGSAIIVTATGFGVNVVLRSEKQSIRQSQPFFLIMVCIGSALMGSTIIPLAIDDEIASQRGCDVACMIAPWLFTVGFSFVFAALYSKLLRLNILMKNAISFNKIKVTTMDVMLPFCVLLGLNLVFLITWTAADPMYWHRSETSPTSSYGLCRLGSNNVSIAMAILVFGVNILALILALIETYKARKVTYDLSDGGSISMVVISVFQVCLVGVPILPLVKDDPSAGFLLKSGLVFVISLSCLLFIFIPILRKKDSPVGSRSASHFRSGSNVPPYASRPSDMQLRSGGSESSVFMSRDFVEPTRTSDTVLLESGRISHARESSVIHEESVAEQMESPEKDAEVTTVGSASSILQQLVLLIKGGELVREDVIKAIGEEEEIKFLVEKEHQPLQGIKQSPTTKELEDFIHNRGLEDDLAAYINAHTSESEEKQYKGAEQRVDSGSNSSQSTRSALPGIDENDEGIEQDTLQTDVDAIPEEAEGTTEELSAET